jgi:hypothetical protein
MPAARGRDRREAVAVALVVTGLVVGATLPRGGPLPAPAVAITSAPASPCEALGARQRDACLKAARDLLAR